MNRVAPLIALLAAGCDPFATLPYQESITVREALWNPETVVPTTDGLYVSLPKAGAVALVKPRGEANRVDLGEGEVTKLAASPDNETVVAFVQRVYCDSDEKRLKAISDCDRRDQVRETELSIIRGGKPQGRIDVEGSYNALTFSDDGQFAIAYLDFDAGVELEGVIDLTSVVVLDLASGVSTPVSVGFAADRVLFVEDGGAATAAVVLSQSSVALVNLEGSTPTKEVTFPLTLDPDSQVDPIGVDLTPNGANALISVRGSADLYSIDLNNQSINIVELAANPSDMSVNAGEDRTMLVYNGLGVVEVLDHEYFDIETFTLDEPMNTIVGGEGFGLLANTSGGHDVYRLDLQTNELVEYRLQNPAVSVHMAPTEEYAVVLTRAEGGFGDGVEGLYDRDPGMEVVDLRGKSTQTFRLDSDGVGVAFSASETELSLLLLQEGIEYLYQLDMYTGDEQEIDLSAAPVRIGTMPDGTFFITHEAATGLVSFLDPTTGKITEAAGFATLGLADPIELAERKGGN